MVKYLTFVEISFLKALIALIAWCSRFFIKDTIRLGKYKPSSGHLWTLIKSLEHNTIETWKLARSWSSFEILKFCLKHYLRMPGGSSLVISIMLLIWTTERFQVIICGTNKVIIKKKMGLFWLSEDLKIWEYNLEGLTAHYS